MDITEPLISQPSDWVMSAETRKIVLGKLGDGERVDQTCNRFHHEWIVEMQPRTETADYQRALRNPDEEFLKWLDRRLSSPFYVPYRAFDHVAEKYGEEFASLFYHKRWEQEIAWAHRIRRGSPNNTMAFFSDFWLKQVMKNSANVFISMMDYYKGRNENIPFYTNSTCHDMDVDEILNCRNYDTTYRPLYLVFAFEKWESAKQMPLDKFFHYVGLVRGVAEMDYWEKKRKAEVDHIKAAPPSEMKDIKEMAARYNLREELKDIEIAFLEDVQRGFIKIKDKEYWQVFVTYLQDARDKKKKTLEEHERLRTVGALNLLKIIRQPLPEEDPMEEWYQRVRRGLPVFKHECTYEHLAYMEKRDKQERIKNRME